MLRRVLLVVSFFCLLAGVGVLWSWRFEREDLSQEWTLADLQPGFPGIPGVTWAGTAEAPVLRMERHPGQPPIALRMTLPEAQPLEALMLAYTIRADGLLPGNEVWQDGRLVIEWIRDDRHSSEFDPGTSARYDDEKVCDGIVFRPEAGRALPALRLEHLGQAGKLEITRLRLTAVRERAVWRVGRWGLAVAWIGWTLAWLTTWPGTTPGRASVVAVTWVVLLSHFAVPGPWKCQRPLIVPFQIGHPEQKKDASPGMRLEKKPASARPGGEEIGNDKSAAGVGRADRIDQHDIPSGPIEPTGRLKVGGGLVLKIKYWLVAARPLLHALLLAVPVFCWACLVGPRPALWLGLCFALAVELAQTSFGYGFGWDDVFDLLCDAAGIAAGRYAAGRVRRSAECEVPSEK